MRVDYTLPALQPETLAEMPATGETGPSFRDQLRRLTVQAPVGWQQQLRLDTRPFTGTYIGPPPRPQSLELKDPETERSRWRNMLQRHSMALASGRASASTSQPVQRMPRLYAAISALTPYNGHPDVT